MRPTLLIFVLVYALDVSSARGLKCYMCDSFTNEACESDPRGILKPVTCDGNGMSEMNKKMRNITELRDIVDILDADFPGSISPKASNIACMKMIAKVDAKKLVIVRGCQTAEGEVLKPCKEVNTKLKQKGIWYSNDSCQTCGSNGCNNAVAFAPKLLLHLPLPLFGFFALQGIIHCTA